VKLAPRLLLQSLAIVGVMVVSVVLIIDNQLYSSIVDQTTHDLAGEARLVATEWRPDVDPDSLADQAGVATGHRITLIDSTGHVVGDSEFDGPALQALENHATRPEVVAARQTGIGSIKRMSPSTGEEQLYVAVKAPRGTARVSVTTRAVEDIFASARSGVLVAGLISFLLAGILAVLFSRSVSKPIVDLSNVARSLAAGERKRHPPLAAPGEVGDLADAVHRLAEQLEARISALAAEQSVLSALVETLNEGVIAISPAHEVVRISETGRRLLSIDRPVPFGVDFLPRDATLRNAIALALSGTATEPEELIIDETTLSLTARPLVNGGAVVALFDLTPIRKLPQRGEPSSRKRFSVILSGCSASSTSCSTSPGSRLAIGDRGRSRYALPTLPPKFLPEARRVRSRSQSRSTRASIPTRRQLSPIERRSSRFS
jgi:two-component system phosphate regulon sensor histidine kinase PhoR